MRRVLLFGVFWVACAEANAEATQPVPALAAGDVVQVGLGLVVILAVIALFAWGARRWLRITPGAHGQIRVLGGLAMGTKERVVLLQVGETQLLVGVGPGQMRTLHVLDKPLQVGESSSVQGLAGVGFAAQLAKTLGANFKGTPSA